MDNFIISSSFWSRVQYAFWRTTAFSYGLIWYGICLVIAFFEGVVFKRPSTVFWKKVQAERERLWRLDQNPLPDVKHAFASLESGVVLHYLHKSTTVQDKAERNENLIIFIHGWPDSSAMWLDLMARVQSDSILSANTTLVAVDLPGFGGSQGLSNYGPDSVLNSLCEFVCNIRDQYLQVPKRGQVIIVAHDWGAFCGFKLAAYAPQIADRFILADAPHTEHVTSKLKQMTSDAKTSLRTWMQSPLHLNPLFAAIRTMRPAFKQLLMSNYVFVFNLPSTLVALIGTGCNLWFPRLVSFLHTQEQKISKQERLTIATRALAGTLGPSADACNTADDQGRRYPTSVKLRAQYGGFLESVRVYREGLASQPWTMSPAVQNRLAQYSSDSSEHEQIQKPPTREQLEKALKNFSVSKPGMEAFQKFGRIHVEQSLQKVLAREQLEGPLHAPVTLIWGLKDQALNYTLLVEGIDAYMVPGSQILALADVGHWVPVDPRGLEVMSNTILWALHDQNRVYSERRALHLWLDEHVESGIAWKGMELYSDEKSTFLARPLQRWRPQLRVRGFFQWVEQVVPS